MTRNENATACPSSGSERLQLALHLACFASFNTSPSSQTPFSRRCYRNDGVPSTSAAAFSSSIGITGHLVPNQSSFPCHLACRIVPNVFTLNDNHPSRSVSSDAVYACHPAILPRLDPARTIYKDSVLLQDSQSHICTVGPTPQPPVHQYLDSPTHIGHNLHVCSSSGACEDTQVMSTFNRQDQNQNHSVWSIDRNNLENAGPRTTPFSQRFPVRSYNEQLLDSAVQARVRAAHLVRPGEHSYGLRNMPDRTQEIGTHPYDVHRGNAKGSYPRA